MRQIINPEMIPKQMALMIKFRKFFIIYLNKILVNTNIV